jgi:membrane fusion protein (multidrug efflux system)
MSRILLEQHQDRPEPVGTDLDDPKSLTIDAIVPDHSSVQRRSSGLLWLAIFAVLALGFLAGRFFSSREASSTPKIELGEATRSTSETLNSIVVTTQPVEKRSLQRVVQAVGTLHGYEEMVVSSKLDGRVSKIYHDLSSVVNPGDLLLELDSTDAQLSVQQAERSLQAELSKWGFATIPNDSEDLSQLPNVVSSKLRYELAKSRLSRMLPLQSSMAITADDLEQAKSEAQVAESDWKNQQLMAKAAAATARLRAAELAIAQQRLKDCQIRVPIPSMADDATAPIYTISERMVSEGSMLRVGTELFKLVLGKTLKLRLAVPEGYSETIRVGQVVEVTTRSSSTAAFGEVKKVSPAVDRTTRTFLVEVEVPNETGKLKPGSFARARILLQSSDEAITVPSSSVYSLAGIQKIFIVDGDVVREHHVTLGEQTKEWVEILSPVLNPGMRVVTSGQRLLSDGIAVTERSTDDFSTNLDSTRSKP